MSAENFDDLTPDRILNCAEECFQEPFANVVMPLPSYINRVYELETAAGERLIFKFYRPGRWNRGALLEEHLFLLDCRAGDIPVVPPLRFPGGGTLKTTEDGIFFAAFEKRWGRALELNHEEEWRRLGTLMARLHLAGEQRPSRFRLHLNPKETTAAELDHLLGCGVVGPSVFREFESAAARLERALNERWAPCESIRLHGDAHCGNILSRPDEGLMLIDFDDMLTGPPVQDLWLLLPGYTQDCEAELQWLFDGYRLLRRIDEREKARIELLRAMRMIYFLDWCAHQVDDFNFADRCPGWGTDAFWRRETQELRRQLDVIQSADY